MEDDCYPFADRWEDDWIAAALRWGHVNYAGPWFADKFVSGAGTLADPYESADVSAQCAAFTREAVNFVGFHDRRFGKLGNSHAEHSWRMVRAGYGGREISNGDGTFRGIHYYLISSPLVVMPEVTNFSLNEKTVSEMLQIYRACRDESIHRWAWRTDEEMQQFRREMREIVIPPLMSPR